MPTTDIGLLWLLTREGDVLRRYGVLSDVLEANGPVPGTAFRQDQATADARGEATGSLKAGLFSSLVLDALGGRKGAVNLSLSRASTVEYTYADVTSDAVHLTLLDTWLAGARFVRRTGHLAAELLVADRLYVVVGVLKAAGVNVTLLDEHGAELALGLPPAHDLAGAGLTAGGSSSRTGAVLFRGEQPLVIAAKAARLHFDEGGLWVSPEPVAGSQVRTSGRRPDYLTGPELRVISEGS
jgi:hypothetical protein